MATGRKRQQGLELRFFWGDRHVGEYFMRPGPRSAFCVGSAPGVDFAMGDGRLGAPRFELVRRDGEEFLLRFSSRMRGALVRGGKAVVLGEGCALAEPEGEAFALALEAGDEVSQELGGVRLEARFRPVPGRVVAALADTLDYSALNILLVVGFLAGGFIIAAESEAAAAEAYEDELAGPSAKVKNLAVRIAVAPPSGLAERLKAKRVDPGAPAAAHRGQEGKLGAKKAPERDRRASPAGNPEEPDRSREIVRKMFAGTGGGSAGAVFEGRGLGGELKAALGHLTGSAFGSARGLEGMGLRGDGSGGGGDSHSLGIGRLATRGRGGDGTSGDYGTGVQLGPKKKPVPEIVAESPVVCGGDRLACGLDKDLVRQVIHAHRSQIRYCYEVQLDRAPTLAGKVAVRFVIGPSGSVGSSEVAQSTLGNAGLESCVTSRVRSWLFPRPKTGGVVVVTYPFLFKPAGE